MHTAFSQGKRATTLCRRPFTIFYSEVRRLFGVVLSFLFAGNEQNAQSSAAGDQEGYPKTYRACIAGLGRLGGVILAGLIRGVVIAAAGISAAGVAGIAGVGAAVIGKLVNDRILAALGAANGGGMCARKRP